VLVRLSWTNTGGWSQWEQFSGQIASAPTVAS
jgi:hypothetical protein